MKKVSTKLNKPNESRSVQDYLDLVEELSRLNRGTGLLQAYDTSSNNPYIVKEGTPLRQKESLQGGIAKPEFTDEYLNRKNDLRLDGVLPDRLPGLDIPAQDSIYTDPDTGEVYVIDPEDEVNYQNNLDSLDGAVENALRQIRNDNGIEDNIDTDNNAGANSQSARQQRRNDPIQNDVDDGVYDQQRLIDAANEIARLNPGLSQQMKEFVMIVPYLGTKQEIDKANQDLINLKNDLLQIDSSDDAIDQNILTGVHQIQTSNGVTPYKRDQEVLNLREMLRQKALRDGATPADDYESLDNNKFNNNLYHFDDLNKQQNEQANYIIQALEEQGITDPETIAYMLGTALHETAGRLAPVNEGYYIDNQYGLNPGTTGRREASMRGYSGGDKYFGRGLIQLTHDYNYKKYGDILGIDLVKNPELANDPYIAAKILALYAKDRNIQQNIKNKEYGNARIKVLGADDQTTQIVKNYSNKFYDQIQRQQARVMAEREKKDLENRNRAGNRISDSFTNKINFNADSAAGQQIERPITSYISDAAQNIGSSFNNAGRAVINAPRAVAQAVDRGVQEAGEVLGTGIEKANPTGKYGAGISEWLKNDKEGMKKEQENTAELLGYGDSVLRSRAQGTNLVRQAAGDIADFVGTKFRLPDKGYSEWLANGPTTNSEKFLTEHPKQKNNQDIFSLFAPPVYGAERGESIPEPSKKNIFQQAADNGRRQFNELTTNLNMMKDKTLAKAGEGIKDIQKSVEGLQSKGSNILKKVKLEDLNVGKKIGESGGDNADVSETPIANKTSNDIRDQFFKAGGAEVYKDYLNPGINKDYKGSLATGLFNDAFYEDPERVGNVFGNTHEAKQATDKYRNYINEKYPIKPGGESATLKKRGKDKAKDENGNEYEYEYDYEEDNPIYYENKYNQSIRDSVPNVLSSAFQFIAPIQSKLKNNISNIFTNVLSNGEIFNPLLNGQEKKRDYTVNKTNAPVTKYKRPEQFVMQSIGKKVLSQPNGPVINSSSRNSNYQAPVVRSAPQQSVQKTIVQFRPQIQSTPQRQSVQMQKYIPPQQAKSLPKQSQMMSIRSNQPAKKTFGQYSAPKQNVFNKALATISSWFKK